MSLIHMSNHTHDLSPDNERFPTLHRLRGTVCHRRFNKYLTLRHSNETLKHCCFSERFIFD